MYEYTYIHTYISQIILTFRNIYNICTFFMPLCTLRSFRTNNDKYTREMYTQGEMIKKSVYAQFRLLFRVEWKWCDDIAWKRQKRIQHAHHKYSVSEHMAESIAASLFSWSAFTDCVGFGSGNYLKNLSDCKMCLLNLKKIT